MAKPLTPEQKRIVDQVHSEVSEALAAYLKTAFEVHDFWNNDHKPATKADILAQLDAARQLVTDW